MELYLQYTLVRFHIMETFYVVGTFVFKVSRIYVRPSVSPVIDFVQMKNLH
jgi:hypothetical protein